MSIYIVALIFIPVRTAFIEYSNTADMCYDYVYEYNYYEEYSECMKNYDILGTALLYLWFTLFYVLIIHYLFQLIFFKWFINYIILSNKNSSFTKR